MKVGNRVLRKREELRAEKRAEGEEKLEERGVVEITAEFHRRFRFAGSQTDSGSLSHHSPKIGRKKPKFSLCPWKNYWIESVI